MLKAIDLVIIWTGRVVIAPFIVYLGYIFLRWLYRYLFKMPYCPKCSSRKRAFLIGNVGGGHRCSRCEQYYWYEKGKSYTNRLKSRLNDKR